MKNIDQMTNDEWIHYRQANIDAHHASGKKLTPNSDCEMCDVHDDYVCFYCETDQLGETA